MDPNVEKIKGRVKKDDLLSTVFPLFSPLGRERESLRRLSIICITSGCLLGAE